MNKDMIEQYFRSIVGIEPLSLVRINAGLSKAQKYFVRTEYQHCILKVLPYKIDSRIYDFLNSMRKDGFHVAAPFKWASLKNGHSVVISDWISGSALSNILQNSKKEEQEVLASSVASLLREFHMRC